MSNVGQTVKRVTGSGSLHGNDWLNLGLAAAAGTAGAGLAGAGPMAGLLGAAPATSWATGAGESLGGGLGAAFGMPESAGLLSNISGKGFLRGAMAANDFMKQDPANQPLPQMGSMRPQMAAGPTQPMVQQQVINGGGIRPLAGIGAGDPQTLALLEILKRQQPGAFA